MLSVLYWRRGRLRRLRSIYLRDCIVAYSDVLKGLSKLAFLDRTEWRTRYWPDECFQPIQNVNQSNFGATSLSLRLGPVPDLGDDWGLI